MAHVHFEVFRRQGKGGGWSLAEAVDGRDTAISFAKAMLEDGRAVAVKVVKETFHPESGDYLTLTIFEDGKADAGKTKKKAPDDAESPVPCFKPDDLYSYHARMTIVRVTGEWLARQKLTVSELLHSAASLEKFEATGTVYQHAIQKIAVAQASDSDMPVAQIVKQLNDLCTAAIHRVYRDERKGLFPELGARDFPAFAGKAANRPDASYLLTGTVAKYLASAKGWDDKLKALLALMQDLPGDGAARQLLLTTVDSLVAELLNGAAALADLLGRHADLGHALSNLVELFLGAQFDAGAASGSVNELARFFAKDELPEARSAIANRILSELRAMKRLCPASLEDELKMLRSLANRLVRGQGKYLSNDDLIGAFAERSKRLVTHEPLLQFMASAATPDEKVERLLIVEENIIGTENKRVLASFVMPIIGGRGFDEQICSGAAPAARLQRLAKLQERTLRSGFQDIEKQQIASALDASATRIESKARILAALDARFPEAVDRVQAMLKLSAAGMFTKGELSAKVQRALLAALAKPGFLVAYVEAKPPAERAGAVNELMAHLEGAGIGAEEGRRVLAA